MAQFTLRNWHVMAGWSNDLTDGAIPQDCGFGFAHDFRVFPGVGQPVQRKGTAGTGTFSPRSAPRYHLRNETGARGSPVE